MKYVYTCYKCGFPIAKEEEDCPEFCPVCGARNTQFLKEPFNGSIENRRIHVIPLGPDPKRDPYDISFHHPKAFPARTLHGRIRRFVVQYGDVEQAKRFYSEIFGWDIVPAKGTGTENPLLYCATGPGLPNWEPKYPSFGYGYLKAACTDLTGRYPHFVVAVDSIDGLLPRVGAYGGKVLREKYAMPEGEYAVLEDSEGNPFYIWQTPDDINWDAPECRNDWRWERHKQTLADVPTTPNKVPDYIGREPRKYPRKDLHGRVRFGNIYYKDFKRFQRFWVDLFGWDMCVTSKSSSVGGTDDMEHPDVIIATGPTYESWEGRIPGHMNMISHYAPGELPDVNFTTEVHMDEEMQVTADKVLTLGGRVIGKVQKNIPSQSQFLNIQDPFGNLWPMWKCRDSRTWDEAESFCDIEAQ